MQSCQVIAQRYQGKLNPNFDEAAQSELGHVSSHFQGSDRSFHCGSPSRVDSPSLGRLQFRSHFLHHRSPCSPLHPPPAIQGRRQVRVGNIRIHAILFQRLDIVIAIQPRIRQYFLRSLSPVALHLLHPGQPGVILRPLLPFQARKPLPPPAHPPKFPDPLTPPHPPHLHHHIIQRSPLPPPKCTQCPMVRIRSPRQTAPRQTFLDPPFQLPSRRNPPRIG